MSTLPINKNNSAQCRGSREAPKTSVDTIVQRTASWTNRKINHYLSARRQSLRWLVICNMGLHRLYVFSDVLKMWGKTEFFEDFCNIWGKFCVFSFTWWLVEHLLSCIGHIGDYNEPSPPSTGCRVHSLHSNYVLHDTADLLAVVATSLFKNGYFERIRSIICHPHLAQECQTSRQGSRRAKLIQRRIRVISLRTGL